MILDLFPLSTTILPYQFFPLQIFESRYLQMMDNCYRNNRPVGICLIKEGHEVGAPAIPHKIGTSAIITELHKVRENFFITGIRGDRRFRITRLVCEQPHIQVEIEWIDSEKPVFEGDYPRLRLMVKLLLEKLAAKSRDLPKKDNELLGLVGNLTGGMPLSQQEIIESEAGDLIARATEILQSIYDNAQLS